MAAVKYSGAYAAVNGLDGTDEGLLRNYILISQEFKQIQANNRIDFILEKHVQGIW